MFYEVITDSQEQMTTVAWFCDVPGYIVCTCVNPLVDFNLPHLHFFCLRNRSNFKKLQAPDKKITLLNHTTQFKTATFESVVLVRSTISLCYKILYS